MNRKRLTQIALSILAIPLFVGTAAGTVTASTTGSGNRVLLAQSPETPAEPAEPEQPAAESPEEPAEPAEPAPKSNWLLIGGAIVVALVIIALISLLSRRPRDV